MIKQALTHQKEMIKEALLPTNFDIQGTPEIGLYCEFLDEELDVFTVEFNYDRCATIITGKNKYIKISGEDLRLLDYLVDETNYMYEDYYKTLKK